MSQTGTVVYPLFYGFSIRFLRLSLVPTFAYVLMLSTPMS